jgi:hypothetical protein
LLERAVSLSHFAEEFIQPDNDGLLTGGLGQAVEAIECVLHGLAAGYDAVYIDPPALVFEESQHFVFKDVIPERQKRGSAGVHD